MSMIDPAPGGPQAWLVDGVPYVVWYVDGTDVPILYRDDAGVGGDPARQMTAAEAVAEGAIEFGSTSELPEGDAEIVEDERFQQLNGLWTHAIQQVSNRVRMSAGDTEPEMAGALPPEDEVPAVEPEAL